MPTDSDGAPRALPARPNLRHLKDQAKDLLKSGAVHSLADAQFKIARLYGFASWPKLKAHVDSLNEIGELKDAIDTNDLDRIVALMSRNPSLHQAPLGYGKNGPLTWVAECRVPWEPPSETRLAIAKWMIESGSDVHQGGDGPLMRAALNRQRIQMMELLVAHGADTNAEWGGSFPIIFAACEAVNPVSLEWLLRHGANPKCANQNGRGTALDYLIEAYWRSPELGECMDLILNAGGTTKYDVPGVLDLLRGRLDSLAERIAAEPSLAHRRFPELDFGASGGRRLTLKGATLLHLAAEYGSLEAAKLLLSRGADVNTRASVDEAGVGGQTPIFHAATQSGALPMVNFLLEHGADLAIRVKLPGHYERPDEIVECTPLGYAILFPGGEDESQTVARLRANGAPE